MFAQSLTQPQAFVRQALRFASLSIMVGLAISSVAPSAHAQFGGLFKGKSPAERSELAASTIGTLMGLDGFDTGVPAKLVARADCIAVLPQVRKGAFIVGGKAGGGIASCRVGRGWSMPIYIKLWSLSVGLQAGGQQSDLLLVFVGQESQTNLSRSGLTLGADVAVSAGPVGREGSLGGDPGLNSQVYSYSLGQGAFAGVSIEGLQLKPDEDANRDVYGKDADARRLLLTTTASPAVVPGEGASFIAALALHAPMVESTTPTAPPSAAAEPTPAPAATATPAAQAPRTPAPAVLPVPAPGFTSPVPAPVGALPAAIPQAVVTPRARPGATGRCDWVSISDASDSRVRIEAHIPFDAPKTRFAVQTTKLDADGDREESAPRELSNELVSDRHIARDSWLRGGPGDYEVRVSAYEDRGGSGVPFVQCSQIVESSDQADRSFALPSRMVQSDDPQVIALAGRILSGFPQASGLEMARSKAIHDWVVNHVAYDFASLESYNQGQPDKMLDQSAVAVLARGTGVCAGYSTLMAALHRAAGFHAKVVYGFAFDSRAWLDARLADKSASNHGWNEILIDGRWVVEDATWDDPIGGSLRHKYFDPTATLFSVDHYKTEEVPYF